MQRSLAVVLLLLLIGVGAFFMFWGGDTAPIAPDPGRLGPVLEGQNAAHNAIDNSDSGDPVSGVAHRTEIAVGAPNLLDDPEIQAGLSGFRGRVVTHKKDPVADCGVRLYRGAMDVILGEKTDIFAEDPSVIPNYVAGETQTAEDGTFLISGVWPRGFYIMFAGIGTDAPMHQIVTRTPSPGEIVDLGDIELPDAGVIIGTVVDEDGEPLVGALVRAADLPGTVVGFFPIERFDPEGAILIREKGAPMDVVEMPGWVKTAFEHIPIPSTVTDSEGNFRLVGVTPGSNMLAVTAKNYLSDVKPSVQVRAGREKDVGRIRLRTGEELIGKVVDGEGKAVVDAEVFAGSTIAIAPVDLGRRLEKTDAEGKFEALGFSPGKVTVAARRGPGHAWVIAEPQSILQDVIVTLPSTYGVLVTVTAENGEVIEKPRFKLLRGKAGDGAAEMAVFGFVPPVSLRDRIERTKEGPWHISNLNDGEYTVVADAPGFATGFATFQLEAADAIVTLQLRQKREFQVRVVDNEDNPIRNAAIFAEIRGESLFDMPINCGRTKSDGTLTIDKFQADSLRVSADHPKWGYVHGEATLLNELVLRMEPPGSLQGVLTENGAPPDPGKYTVFVEWRRNGGPRGPLEQVPMMVTAGLDGTFKVAALQPGQYNLQAINSLDSIRSPGGIMSMFMSVRMVGGGRDQRTSVDVVAGQTTQAHLEVGEKLIEGPTAHIFGSVTVDGRLAEGYQVMAYFDNRRYNATVDRTGRFDLGIVPAGRVDVQIMAEGGMFGMSEIIWQNSFELKEAEEKELLIEVQTTSMSGMVITPDGSSTAGMHVRASGRLKDGNRGVSRHAAVDAQGNFSFKKIPEGTWELQVRGGGEKSMRGKLEDLEVAAGVPLTMLRLHVHLAIEVKGKIDMTMFAKKPQWAWISIHKLKPDGSMGVQAARIGVDVDDGEFDTDALEVGSYGVRLHAHTDGKQQQWRCQNLDVPPQGLEGVLLRGTPE